MNIRFNTALTDKAYKVYVQVLAAFNEQGDLRPLWIHWEDGRLFRIDRVKSIRPAASRRTRAEGDCYIVEINGRERALYFEHAPGQEGPTVGRWFVERKQVR